MDKILQKHGALWVAYILLLLNQLGYPGLRSHASALIENITFLMLCFLPLGIALHSFFLKERRHLVLSLVLVAPFLAGSTLVAHQVVKHEWIQHDTQEVALPTVDFLARRGIRLRAYQYMPGGTHCDTWIIVEHAIIGPLYLSRTHRLPDDACEVVIHPIESENAVEVEYASIEQAADKSKRFRMKLHP